MHGRTASWIAIAGLLALLASTPPAAAEPEPAGSPAVEVPFPAGPLVEAPIAFQFAVYYLPRAAKDPAQTLAALCKERHPGFNLVNVVSRDMKLPALRGYETPIADYRPPPLESVKGIFGKGLTEEQAGHLAKSEQVFVMVFFTAEADRLSVLQQAIALAAEMARAGGGLVWDENTRQVFAVDTWLEMRAKRWTAELPNLEDHVVQHLYAPEDGALIRLVSLGMDKFGLPDVGVTGVPRSWMKSMGSLVNVACQTMLERGRIDVAGRLDLDLDAIGNAAFRERILSTLEEGAKRKLALAVRVGRPLPGDPERLIEIVFDAADGKDPLVAQASAIAELFGAHEEITRESHDDAELNEASARARARLTELKARFQKGLAPGEQLLLKGPFAIPTGGNEWMWIEVTEWSETEARGILANDAFDIPGLVHGTRVSVKLEEVYDYLLYRFDGSFEGNETGKIMEARSKGRK